MSRRLMLSAAALLSASLPSAALAGGLEYAGGTGARSLARAGAVHAKADNPLVLRYNPAGLAELRGGMLNGSLNVALHDACYDAYGYYGWGVYSASGIAQLPGEEGSVEEQIPLGPPSARQNEDGSFPYHSEPLPEVCMDQGVAMIPNGVVSMRLTEDLGIGFGMIFPSAMPNGRWADQHGLIRNEEGQLRPSPARHMTIVNGSVGIFPTVGAGYRLMDSLRIGAAFQWGIIWADAVRATPTGPGTKPGEEVLTRVVGDDFFVPGVTGSVHWVPWDFLDVVGTFRWQDDIRLDNATAWASTGYFGENQIPTENQELLLDYVYQPMPWAATVGIRFSDRIFARPTGTGWGEGTAGTPIHDPMNDERWDIEVDVQYQFNARVDRTIAFPVDTCERDANGDSVIGTCQEVLVKSTDSEESIFFPNEKQLNGIFIDRYWQDQYSIRAGGSYNVLPGRFSLHAGAHYENRGIDPAYMTPDAWPLARVGLHGGATLRWRNLDFTLAYGKIIQETLTVGSPPHGEEEFNPETGQRQINKKVGFQALITDPQPPPLEDPSEAPLVDGVAAFEQQTGNVVAGRPTYIVNQGKYTSALDLFAVSITAHF